jgi:hypothetical protein
MLSNTVYLVVEPIELIASDLAMNVQEYDPSAEVLIALTPEAGCEVLKSQPSVQLAFVHVDPSGFSNTDLGRALAERGARLVFTGDAAERKDKGIVVLHRPFSAQTTATLLQGIQSRERA